MSEFDTDVQPSLFDETRVIPSRTTDPETSHAAAKQIVVKAGTQRWHLLAAFAAHDHEYGLTDEEAAQASSGVSLFSEYAKRCSELREAGLIEPTGDTRPGSAGPQRIVSRITANGRNEWWGSLS